MTDPDAFTALYRQTSSGIYRFALHMSGSTHVAEEVTQETFLRLIHKPKKFDSANGTLAGYLFGIARNQVVKRLERERTYVPFAVGHEEEQVAAAPADERRQGRRQPDRAGTDPPRRRPRRDGAARGRRAGRDPDGAEWGHDPDALFGTHGHYAAGGED